MGSIILKKLLGLFFQILVTLIFLLPSLFFIRRSWRRLKLGSKSLWDIWAIFCFGLISIGISFILAVYIFELF
jgi:hypothetical protein